jgi:hypothetical protein
MALSPTTSLCSKLPNNPSLCPYLCHPQPFGGRVGVKFTNNILGLDREPFLFTVPCREAELNKSVPHL